MLICINAHGAENEDLVDLKSVLQKISNIHQQLSTAERKVFSDLVEKIDKSKTYSCIVKMLYSKDIDPILVSLISRKIKTVQSWKHIITLAKQKKIVLESDDDVQSTETTVTDLSEGKEDEEVQMDTKGNEMQQDTQSQFCLIAEPFDA